MDVVSMGMCVYYCVQCTDLSTQKLGAHIWSGVYQNTGGTFGSCLLNEYGAT